MIIQVIKTPYKLRNNRDYIGTSSGGGSVSSSGSSVSRYFSGDVYLEGLRDVDINQISDKQLLVYDEESSTWKNQDIDYLLSEEYTKRDVDEQITGRWYFKNTIDVTRLMFRDTNEVIYGGLEWVEDIRSFIFRVGGADKFVFTEGGDFGIGIIPTEKLHVNGNGLFEGDLTADVISSRILINKQYKIYSYAWGGGVDTNWYRIATLRQTDTTVSYRGINGEVVVWDEYGNHGNNVPRKFKYVFSFRGMGGNASISDEIKTGGSYGVNDRVRIVKISTNHYELQVRQPNNYIRMGAELKIFTNSTNASAIESDLAPASTGTVVPLGVDLHEYFGNIYTIGNVGIGTTNPQEKLHVVGNGLFTGYVRVGGTYPQIQLGDSDNLIFKHASNGSFIFRVGGADKFVFTKGGDFGIGLTPTEKLHVAGNSLITGIGKFGSDLQTSGTFVSGFAGSGWKLDGSESHLTVDKLTVRKTFDVYELVINKIRATNGSLWVSDALKVDYATRRSDVDNYTFNLYWDIDGGNKPCPFVVNDIIKAQHFDGRKVIEVIGRVDYIGTTYVKFKTAGYSNTHVDEVDNLAGLEFVRIGNRDDTNRQGAIFLTSSDDGAPFIDVLDGVTGSSISGKTRLRVGKLSGISGQSGYGIWGSRNGSDTDFVISSDGYAKIAGWGFNNESLYKTHGNLKLSLGKAYYWESNAYGLQIGQDRSNRVWIGATETDYELAMWKDGKYYFKLALNGTKIAGFSFDDTYLYTNKYGYDSGIELRGGSAPRLVVHKNYANYVATFYDNDNDWGIVGQRDGKYVFQFGSTNQFAGVNFDNSRLWTANWELKADGTATFTKGTIGGWNISDNRLYRSITGAKIEIGTNNYTSDVGFVVSKDAGNRIGFGFNSSGDVFLNAFKGSSRVFELGTSMNVIAGINFDGEKLYTSKWSLNKNGSFSFGGGKITGDAIGNVTIDSSHIVNVRKFVLKPYLSTAISGSSSSPTSIDTSNYSCAIVSNGTGSSKGYIKLSNGQNGQIFVVFPRNDSGSIRVYGYMKSENYIDLAGGEVGVFMFVSSSMYNSSVSNRWILISRLDNNW